MKHEKDFTILSQVAKDNRAFNVHDIEFLSRFLIKLDYQTPIGWLISV